jgi:hypothetical protein
MEKYLKLLLVAGILSLVPLIASAHQRQVFRIGGRAYTFVVGFQNEPVFAGDKSGLDLRIRLADPKAPLNFSSPNLKPVEKLETSLKVEISAGGKKKVFGLEPAFRDPGLYRATFFPTAATSYRFRLFGEMNGTPVDLAFTCNAEDGHPRSEEDRSEVKLSDRVTRIFQSGAFGCPRPREAVEFP